MKKDKNININAESKANVKEAKKLAKAEKKAIKSDLHTATIIHL